MIKGQLISKSRLASRRFSKKKKRTEEFDFFAVKSKKANKTNSFVFGGEKLADHKLLLKLTDLFSADFCLHFASA